MTFEELRKHFCNTVTTHIHREGVHALLAWLDTTDFYHAPASTKYHDAVVSGLCMHSLNVFNRLKTKLEQYKDITGQALCSDETCAIVSLFHDLCKINFYTTEFRNVKDEFGNWTRQPYYKCEDSFPLGHGEKSMFIVHRYMKLSDEEALAIRWHMGGFGVPCGSSEAIALSGAMSQSKLVIMLHEADLEAAYWDKII